VVVYQRSKRRAGDCTMLSNGNILFSRQYGASEITPDKKIVWDYDGPKGTEIHTAYPIGRDRVLIMQNGDPAKALIIDKATNRVEKELVLPTKDKSTHGQFRHIRMTKAGTFLVAHMDLGKVVEYAPDGKVLWSVDAPSAWAAVRLANGNTLISGNAAGYVREVNPRGETVWEINKHDLPGIPLFTVQEVSRLANGNTLINNWSGGLPPDEVQSAVQLVEITPDKKVVWALKDWKTLGRRPPRSCWMNPASPKAAAFRDSGGAHGGRRGDILRRAHMDLSKVLADLRRELADLDAAIASLEQLPQARPRRGTG